MAAKIPIGLRIDRDLYAAIQESADKANRSMSAEIVYQLRRAMRRQLAAYREAHPEATTEETE